MEEVLSSPKVANMSAQPSASQVRVRQLCRECGKERLQTLVRKMDAKVPWYALNRTELTNWLVEHAPETLFDVKPRRAPKIVAKLPCANASESGPGLAHFAWIGQLQRINDTDFWYFVPEKEKKKYKKKA
jgi:hypothetical protein